MTMENITRAHISKDFSDPEKRCPFCSKRVDVLLSKFEDMNTFQNL